VVVVAPSRCSESGRCFFSRGVGTRPSSCARRVHVLPGSALRDRAPSLAGPVVDGGTEKGGYRCGGERYYRSHLSMLRRAGVSRGDGTGNLPNDAPVLQGFCRRDDSFLRIQLVLSVRRARRRAASDACRLYQQRPLEPDRVGGSVPPRTTTTTKEKVRTYLSSRTATSGDDESVSK